MTPEVTDVACPGCGEPMRSNGYTMFCEKPGCAFNSFKPRHQPPDYPIPRVLDRSEEERIYLQGVNDYHAGKQFHQSPYPASGQKVPDDEYQRGYEWRRGWNDAACGKAPKTNS